MTGALDALDAMGTAPPAHSPLGASGADRWLHCPGSYRESLKAPPRRASIHAATGTVAHNLIEGLLVRYVEMTEMGIPLPQTVDIFPSKQGQNFTVDGHVVSADDEMFAGIATMLNYVLSRWVEDVELAIEKQVALNCYWSDPKDQPPVSMFGRCDVLLRDVINRTLELVDYKNGTGVVVDPVQNPQLLYYAAGALALPENSTIEHVILTVVQPNTRSPHKSASWAISAANVRKWVDDVLKPGVRAVQAPDAPLHMGSWCRFCPVLSQCPAHIDAAREAARVDFADSGEIFPPAELGRLLDLAENVSRWADALRERAAETLRAEDTVIPGWQLVPTRPVRNWSGDLHSLERALLAHGVDIKDCVEIRWLTPARLQPLLPPKVWAKVSRFVVSKSSGTKLARSNAADDFDNLSEQGS